MNRALKDKMKYTLHDAERERIKIIRDTAIAASDGDRMSVLVTCLYADIAAHVVELVRDNGINGVDGFIRIAIKAMQKQIADFEELLGEVADV